MKQWLALLVVLLVPTLALSEGAVSVHDVPEGEVTAAVFAGQLERCASSAEGTWAEVSLTGEAIALGWAEAEALTSASSTPATGTTTATVLLQSTDGAFGMESLPAGKTMTLLGRTVNRWLVRCDGLVGSVLLTELDVPKDAADALYAAMPAWVCRDGDTLAEVTMALSRMGMENSMRYGKIDRWPLEEQQQYSLYCRAACYPQVALSGLPDEGDIPYEDAVLMAYEYFASHTEEVVPGLDGHTIGRQFLVGERHRWIFNFYRDGLQSEPYCVTLDAHTGDIMEATAPKDYAETLAIGEDAAAAQSRFVQDQRDVGKAFLFWSMEDKHAYATAHDWTEQARCETPPEGALPADEVERIARRTLLTRFGMTQRRVDSLFCGVSYQTGTLDNGGISGYLAEFYLHTGLGETSDDYTWFASVTIDAFTGEVLEDTSGK